MRIAATLMVGLFLCSMASAASPSGSIETHGLHVLSEGRPTGLSAEVVGQDVILSWNMPHAGVPDGYTIVRLSIGGVPTTVGVAGSQTTYTDAGAGSGSHLYAVMASYNGMQSAPSEPAFTGNYPTCTWLYHGQSSSGQHFVGVNANCLLPPPGTAVAWAYLERLIGSPIIVPVVIVPLPVMAEAA